MQRKTILRLAIAPAVGIAALSGAVAFGVAKPPPPMTAITQVAIDASNREPMAPLLRFTAHDGASLGYRAWRPAASTPGQPVALMIHGSGGSSRDMNIIGRALAAQGTAAYAPDIRGHGVSGAHGDIDHVGQLEEDLSDLVAQIHHDDPGAPIILVGHSSGGGFALRVAGEPEGAQFARFVLLAPYLGPNEPTSRPDSGGWVAPFIPRIAGLTILNRFGISAFNHLPTIAFATPAGKPPKTWSYTLMTNFAPPGLATLNRGPVEAAAAKAKGRISVVAGDHDESMVASAYAGEFPGAPVSIVPGVGHMGVISDPSAVPVVVAAIRG